MSFGTRPSNPLRNVLDPSLYPTKIRRLYLHQLQFQFLLVHFGFLFRGLVILCRILFDLFVVPGKHPHLLNLDAALVCWEFLAWLGCRFLFRHPEQFLWFRRPSRNYVWAVYITTSIVTIPNIAIQIAIICLSTKIETQLSRNWTVAAGLLALLFTIPFFILIFRMAQKFLLVDQDSQYEPTIAREDRANSEGYTDRETSTSSSLSPLWPGLLSAAYTNQVLSSTYGSGYQGAGTSGQSPGAPGVFAEETITVSQEQDNDINTTSADDMPITNNTNSALGCHSLAYFEFLPQSRMGYSAWLSFPIITTFFGLYSTIAFGLILSLIHENNKYPRIKSPDTINGLFMVPTGYALCLFTAKLRLRTTLFIKRNTSLPGGWTEFSHWVLGTTYIHSETNTTTEEDPRYRTHGPSQTPEQPESHGSSMIQQHRCNDYWGHNGRGVTVKRRFWPVLVRISILVIIVKYFLKGWTSITFGATHGKPSSTIDESNHHAHMIYLTNRYTMWLMPLRMAITMYAISLVPVLCYFWLTALKDGKIPDKEGVKWIY